MSICDISPCPVEEDSDRTARCAAGPWRCRGDSAEGAQQLQHSLLQLGVLGGSGTGTGLPFCPSCHHHPALGCLSHWLCRRHWGYSAQISYAEMPVWQEILPFHCSATLSEQGTLADSSTFQFSDYNTCVTVLEPGQPVYLYPTVSFVHLHCDHMGQKSLFTVNHRTLCASLSVPNMISVEHSLLEKRMLPVSCFFLTISASSSEHVSVLQNQLLNCLEFMLSSL